MYDARAGTVTRESIFTADSPNTDFRALRPWHTGCEASAHSMSKLQSRSSLSLFFTLAGLGACVGDDVVPAEQLEPQTGATATIDPPPPPHQRVRELKVTCAVDLQGHTRLQGSARSDVGVTFAFIELDRDTGDTFAGAAFPLDLRFVGPFYVDGHFLVPPGESLDTGRLVLDDSNHQLTCENLGTFGIKAQIDFEDGTTACAFGGDPQQAAKLHCK
jgi:hypothetical protein